MDSRKVAKAGRLHVNPRGQGSDVGCRRSDVRCPRADVGDQEAEDKRVSRGHG